MVPLVREVQEPQVLKDENPGFLIFQWMRSQRSRLFLLFFSSCIFYGWLIPKYLLVLFTLILIDYWAGIKIEESGSLSSRKRWLQASLAGNLGILGFFKYFNFFTFNLKEISNALGWNLPIPILEIALPIGLSFHTFQSLAYVIEIHRGRFRAERNLLRYSVYVLYFPQMVAGPIERPQNILPQLKEHSTFDPEKAITGLFLLLQGLFKKCVVADSLAPLANRIFDHPDEFGLLGVFLGTVSFAFQIYCDFSGYSDMARGISRLFGIELMVNFDRPYLSKSVSEFWRRWHISLSTWFRDYMFIPLGGSRCSPIRKNLNLMAVFLVSGLWHGANWTFVVWGGVHGTSLILEKFIPSYFRRLWVLPVVFLGWVFFRAQTLTSAFDVLSGYFRAPMMGLSGLPTFQIVESVGSIMMVSIMELAETRNPFWSGVRKQRPLLRWSIYYLLMFLFFFTARFTGEPFLYFQF